MKRAIVFAAAAMVAFNASAATLTLPSISIVTPTSATITCPEVGGTGAIHPGAPGTVLFNCTVSPANWVGTMSVSNTKFVIVNTALPNFDIAVGSVALTPGTMVAGTVTTTP